MAVAKDLVKSPSVKYRSPELGQSPESGFDCSGFVKFVLLKAGLTVPDFIGMDNVRRPIRHANEFWDHFGVFAQPDLAGPGDLIFFTRNGAFPTHIGIVRDPESYIHAPGRDGTAVEIAPIKRGEVTRPAPARKLYKSNPIGYKSPTCPILEPSNRYHQQVVD